MVESLLIGRSGKEALCIPACCCYRRSLLPFPPTLFLQEAERYSRPWSPYVYNQHGYASVVGPVRSLGGAWVNGRSRAALSARDHPLLRPDRPPWVSISEIVRDAVARLPNGEGTRPEIAMLAQDSGYLVATFNPRQVRL